MLFKRLYFVSKAVYICTRPLIVCNNFDFESLEFSISTMLSSASNANFASFPPSCITYVSFFFV